MATEEPPVSGPDDDPEPTDTGSPVAPPQPDPKPADNGPAAEPTDTEPPVAPTDVEQRNTEVDTAELDETELVGPGRYPLRIQPAAALRPGTADCKRLLVSWYIRKSFYWMSFLGIMVAAVTEYTRHPDAAIDLAVPSNVDEPSVLATWGLFLFAIALKFVNSWIALGLAVPLALAHEPNLSPRTNFGSGIGKFFDRKHIASAYRSLRWTHHVREIALQRLGPAGKKVARLDPILDIVNIASGVLAFIVISVVAALTPP